MKKLTGTINHFFETGTEGIYWVFEEDGKSGYEQMHSLTRGDHLKVYGEDGAIVFDDYIDPDFKAGWQEYPNNPGNGQPCVFRLWIHWTQKGWEPERWAKLFLREGIKWRDQKDELPKLRAELIKRKQ